MAENKKNKKNSILESVNKNPKGAEGYDFKTLQIEETNYKTLYTRKFTNRNRYKPVDPKKILSYIPGTILKILVEKGQKLEAGTPILILEAMKMRNIVTMPVSGKLKVIYVKEGETIPKNFLIAEVV